MLVDLSDFIDLAAEDNLAAMYRALFALIDELDSALAETHQVRFVHYDSGNFLEILPAPPSPVWNEALEGSDHDHA